MDKNEIIINCLDEAVDKIFEQIGEDGTLSFADMHEALAEMFVERFYSLEDLKENVENEIKKLESKEAYYKEIIAAKDDDKNERRRNSLAEILEKKERLIESLESDAYIGEGFCLAVYSLMCC